MRRMVAPIKKGITVNKGRLAGTLMLAALLGGCAQMIFEKSGVTQQEFSKDKYECERDSRQSGYYGEGLVGALNMQGFFDRCMEARGYTKRQAKPGEQLMH